MRDVTAVRQRQHRSCVASTTTFSRRVLHMRCQPSMFQNEPRISLFCFRTHRMLRQHPQPQHHRLVLVVIFMLMHLFLRPLCSRCFSHAPLRTIWPLLTRAVASLRSRIRHLGSDMLASVRLFDNVKNFRLCGANSWPLRAMPRCQRHPSIRSCVLRFLNLCRGIHLLLFLTSCNRHNVSRYVYLRNTRNLSSYIYI